MRHKFHFILALSILFATLSMADTPNTWLPISNDDLAMKDFAPFPGAHAVILYRKLERNDPEGWERRYYRIKILDEEGKKYANIETEAVLNNVRTTNLDARAIRPDGTIVPFEGKAQDKVIAKYKGVSFYGKAFTLPDIQVGSIVEYQYTTRWDPMYLYDSTWIIQENLPIRDADFSLRYNLSAGYDVSWLTFLLPKNTSPSNEKGIVALTLHGIAPFEKEEFMPPQKELQARVEFIYGGRMRSNLDEYWKEQARQWYKGAQSFMDKRKAAQNYAASVVGATDTPDVKLRKLYEQVQKFRNLTYERRKSEKEQEREKLKDILNVEDVLKHGYGYHNELVRTFVALAKASGIDANLIRVTERDQYFYHKDIPKFERVDTELAVVKVDGKDLYLDPGVPFAPYGLLSWEDTATVGLLLNKDTAIWQAVPQPEPDQALQQRTAQLELDRDGTLHGNLKVTFQGQDALYRRLLERENDDTQRRKDLEDNLKNWLPVGSKIELTSVDDWNAPTETFSFAAKITIENFAAATGKRLLIPISIFPGSDNHAFAHARRVNPVYLRNPYRERDEVTVSVPEGLQVETLPSSRQVPTPFADLQLTTLKDGNTFKIDRQLVMKGYYFSEQQFPYLRQFLDQVKAIGDEQAVLRAAAK